MTKYNSTKQLNQKIKNRKKFVKKISFLILFLLITGFITWLILRSSYNKPKIDNGLISKNGLHWHAQLSIKINGQLEKIPADVGLKTIHLPIHTHETDGTIHLEFSGLTTKQDTQLGQFFNNWGKVFNSNCIFDYCTDNNKKLSLYVNGQPNWEFDKYEMKDNDTLEIVFE
ncbi:hypothetical protein KKC17_03480 [Patescibacteria group bacterium]|nr:hypothetical protein [Patescibacteria group bacterium]